MLQHWWRMEGPGWSFAGAEVDARVGGEYRLGMTGPDGRSHVAVGVYREVLPPKRLAFTWEWEDDPDRGDSGKSLVSVGLRDEDRKTELVLTQSGFPSESSRQAHRARWEDCLGTIARLVE